MFKSLISLFKGYVKPLADNRFTSADEELVVLLLKDASERYAVLYSTKHDLFMLPAGKVEAGENIYRAIIREANEELAISVSRHELRYLGYDYDSYVANGQRRVVKVNVFEINTFTGKASNAEPSKHTQLAWMNRRQLMMTFAIQRPFSANDISLKLESRSLKKAPPAFAETAPIGA